MTRIAGEIAIAAPVERVFDVAADERNEPRYNPRIARAEKLTAGPVGAGTRFVAETRRMRRSNPMTVEYLDYDRPRRLRSSIRSPVMDVEGTLTCEPAGGGTRLRGDWDMRLLGAAQVLTPVLALVGPSWERRNWVGLKRFIERG